MPNRSDIETDVENYFKWKVCLHGGLTEKHVSPGRRGPPDQIVTWRRRPYPMSHRVELKAPGGKIKPWQARYHAMLSIYGVDVFVIHTREQVDAYIKWALRQ